MTSRSIQTAASKTSKKGVAKNSAKPKQNASKKGKVAVINTGGHAQPPYTVTPVQVTAMVPGQGPPMSSAPGSGPRVSGPARRAHPLVSNSASRAKRGSRKK